MKLAWDRFFETYAAWIVDVARFASAADAFAVGTELDQTTRAVRHEARWRAIVDDVREVFPGILTYAANWTDYERVPFWDALDLVGIQAYFPVLTDVAARDVRVSPTDSELEAGWRDIAGRMRRFSERADRPILFTELGYNNSAIAPYEPWDYKLGGPHANALQERLMRIALRAVAAEPSVRGAFLWKWFPGERSPRNFAMSRPAIRRIISRQWGGTAQPH